jgi:tetraacyldisaccharide 4'-kinase
MQILRYILLPFSLLYGSVMYLRNLLFNTGIKEVKKVNATVVSIGNLSMGGTGKTPHVDWIVTKLKEQIPTAILSRGYGRKSKGFVLVTKHSQTETVGDEALFYKRKHKEEIEVAVAEKRVEGAEKLLNLKSNLKLIVLDDAYQHRHIHRDVNILLTDYNAPFYEDFVVPSGRLREFRLGKNRADVVIVTKCPKVLNDAEKIELKRKIDVSPETLVCFSQIKYGEILPINSGEFTVPEQILLVTGIANPEPLYEHLKKMVNVELLSFPDHHDFTTKDIRKIHNLFDTFATQNKCIVTTAKDVPRLCSNLVKPLIENYPWFYQTINVEIDNEQKLLKKIKEHVKKD